MSRAAISAPNSATGSILFTQNRDIRDEVAMCHRATCAARLIVDEDVADDIQRIGCVDVVAWWVKSVGRNLVCEEDLFWGDGSTSEEMSARIFLIDIITPR